MGAGSATAGIKGSAGWWRGIAGEDERRTTGSATAGTTTVAGRGGRVFVGGGGGGLMSKSDTVEGFTGLGCVGDRGGLAIGIWTEVAAGFGRLSCGFGGKCGGLAKEGFMKADGSLPASV